MNVKKILFLSCMLICLLPACFKSAQSEQKLYVINVLDAAEFNDCHIKGSINVPFEQVEEFAKGLNKQTELVLYCSNYWCTGSGQAAQLLIGLGFSKVWAYEAGMAEWYQKKLPVIGAAKASYLTKKVEKPEHSADVPEITTQQLKEKMEQAGLI